VPDFINSVHGAYSYDGSQGRFMFERLGGTQIIRDDGQRAPWGGAGDPPDLTGRDDAASQ
jgi:uncharacterized protein